MGSRWTVRAAISIAAILLQFAFYIRKIVYLEEIETGLAMALGTAPIEPIE